MLSLHACVQRTTKVLINGEFRDSSTNEWVEVKNPVCWVAAASQVCICNTNNSEAHVMQATQEVVSRMPIVTSSEFQEAVQAAKDAFPAWKRTPVPHRQRIMFKFQQLIKDNMVCLSSSSPFISS